MAINKGHIFRSFSGMAFATFLSRILGLIREMLTARIIGGGLVMTAWGLAFTLANFFRRLLGEGAAGTAIVPIISHAIAKDGRNNARKQLAVMATALGVILAVICLLIAAISLLVYPHISVPRWKLTFEIIPFVIPYALFICLVGIFSSVLNSIGRFFLPALLALLLNVTMIYTLIFFCPGFTDEPKKMLICLSAAVIVSGILQLLFLVGLLGREGMTPIWKGTTTMIRPTLHELWSLALPSLIGASALQISLVVDRTLACWISQYGVPSLIYSDRIVYLPIGIFAVSVGAVALSNLSRFAAQNDIKGMLSTFSFCLRQLLFICIPAAIYVFFFRIDLIELFYLGGKFGKTEVEETALALQMYALGIPAFAAIKVSVAMFYSRKKMRTPVKVSIFCITLNIILNLILMWPLKQGGIALATVISSLVNNLVLYHILRKEFSDFRPDLTATIGKSLLAGFGAVLAAMAVRSGMLGCLEPDSLLNRFIHIVVISAVFGFCYLALALLLRTRETREVLGLLKSRKIS